ncbi:MAG: hypothetical protein HKM24_04265, partial [Gammaproteobacteria bacterium]|nr:hypothetical protein [Gammaproteobacteria bacterium]
TSASGTPKTNAVIAATLADYVAIDDVTDPVIVIDNAPSILPLGVTPVVITALDEAGNARAVSVEITIADLEAPILTVPDDVRVMSTGPLTTVTLGFATVSDNVSSVSNILITSDAPAAGFPIGVHTVNWQAEDEVGLISNDTQEVIVESMPPELAATLSDLSTTEGVSIAVDLSLGFSDADSTLSYTISGLPASTGLVLDVATGMLTGAPGPFDADAEPLTVTVSASDEVNEVSQTFDINVVNINNAPSFTLSGDLSALEDFTGSVSVSPVLDPSTPDETGETITFSIAPDPSTINFANVLFNPATGEISMTSIADSVGFAMLTLTADDGQATNNLFSMMVPIDVQQVNDAPTFSLSGNLILPENFPGTEIVTISLDPVPANELGQTITYTISPSSVSFANLVVDSLAGEIQVTSVLNQTGSQLFVVTADDGQPENNTHSQSFNLIVYP